MRDLHAECVQSLSQPILIFLLLRKIHVIGALSPLFKKIDRRETVMRQFGSGIVWLAGDMSGLFDSLRGVDGHADFGVLFNGGRLLLHCRDLGELH